MMRPQLRWRIEGKYRRASRAPLNTFTSKKRCQSASRDLLEGAHLEYARDYSPGYRPCGCFCTKASATLATLKSPANPSTSPPGRFFMAATAASTAAGVRPLTITVAPSRAKRGRDGIADAGGRAADQGDFLR